MKKNILVTSLSFVIAASCADVDGTGMAQIESDQKPLTIYNATLSVVAGFTGITLGATAPSVCIGPGSNKTCYTLPTDATHCNWKTDRYLCTYDSTNLREFGYTSKTADRYSDDWYQNDHPFVAAPDHWDYISVLNNGTATIQLRQFSITIRVTSPNEPIAVGSYTFVDRPSSANDNIGAGKSFSLADLIQERRECIYRTIYCGNHTNESNVCDPDDTACLRGSKGESVVGDVDLADIPWLIEEAIKDLGQTGMRKYAALDTLGNQAGCYGPAGYYLSQYSANIDKDCDRSSSVCDDTDWCEAFSSLDPFYVSSGNYSRNQCSYFKYWNNNMAVGGAQSLIWIDQYIAANRAAIVLYDEDTAGNRADIGRSPNFSICRMDSAGAPLADKRSYSQSGVKKGSYWRCKSTCGTSGAESCTYVPKAGDYTQWCANGGGCHVMLWTGSTVTVTAGGLTSLCVLEKGNPFRGQCWNAARDSSEVYFGDVNLTDASTVSTEIAVLQAIAL